MLPWKIVKKTYTPADKKIEEIKNILFPPMKLKEELNEGKPFKYHIDYSIDSNLDAALIDLQEGNNDQVTQNTINAAIKKLHQIRKMLEAYSEFDKDAKYIIVDNEDQEADIIASDN